MLNDSKEVDIENIKQIHHRVRNNFQVIISLIDMLREQQELKDTRMFLELNNRIRSMAIIYDCLIDDVLDYVDLKKYIKIISSEIAKSYFDDKKHSLKIDCKNIKISIDQINPLSLALNEIITNAYKHNDDVENLNIHIKIQEVGEMLEIYIDDNGNGIEDKYIYGEVETFGLNLSKMLIKDQLDGKLYISNKSGTSVVIKFKKK